MVWLMLMLYDPFVEGAVIAVGPGAARDVAASRDNVR